MGLMGFLHLLWLVPLFAVGLYLLVFAMMVASVQLRNRRYLDGGIDLVDKMTQEQFGTYLLSYFKHKGYDVTISRQDEATGTLLIARKNGQQRIVFAKRSCNGVSDAEVVQALDYAKAAETRMLIVTNSILSRFKDEEVKKQGVEVWDREKLIPYMGKAGARKFALQAIENHSP